MNSFRWSILFFLYRLFSPLGLLVTLPRWWLKMLSRGGEHTPLAERFSFYQIEEEWETYYANHVHAVSVGEANVGLKLIHEWQNRHPEERFVLAVSTASSYLAMKRKESDVLRVIYAPFDLRFFVKRYLKRFSPKQIVLIEGEAWPILLDECGSKKIPVCLANARLSPRSSKRYEAFSSYLTPWWNQLEKICTQEPQDASRFISLGVSKEKIIYTGSVKFDPASDTPPCQRDDFAHMLQAFGKKKIILAASTHAGEEKWLGKALMASDVLFVCVPRHAERRAEVQRDLASIGYVVTLRSQFSPPRPEQKNCFVIDSTGELRDWTAHADAVIIGKSFLAYGGQNPCEAIMAHKPVIAGIHMENFEPLCTSLREKNAMITWRKGVDFFTIEKMLAENTESITQQAFAQLHSHAGATEKTVAALHFS